MTTRSLASLVASPANPGGRQGQEALTDLQDLVREPLGHLLPDELLDLLRRRQLQGLVGQAPPQAMHVPVELHADASAAAPPAAPSIPRSRIVIIVVAAVLGAVVLFLMGFFFIGK